MVDYEQKFTEMKKYIPFLESMIEKLESSNTGTQNPRQAQLSKIMALRDLLLDKNKRMKMDNLLRCEQVLVNLYAKVEQTDILPTNKGSDTPESSKTVLREDEEDPDFKSSSSNLQSIREKLKIVTKSHDNEVRVTNETFVARSDLKDIETKSPQTLPVVNIEKPLFQRRPMKNTQPDIETAPKKYSDSNVQSTPLKQDRSYTRILTSPEQGNRPWKTFGDNSRGTAVDSQDNILFQRRSPKTSPRRRRSRSYNSSRKEEKKKKKASKRDSAHTRLGSRVDSSCLIDNVNITLNVPEESLNSLNTKNIFDRIINCNEDDVDIDQLRTLRTQIVQELKQTGANQDISEYILKSYRKKKKKLQKVEVEEGEISDSDSESIQKIYGNLIIELKNDLTDQNENTTTKEDQVQSASVSESESEIPKIKISLIIANSENSGENLQSQTEQDNSATHPQDSASNKTDCDKDIVLKAQDSDRSPKTTYLNNNLLDPLTNKTSNISERNALLKDGFENGNLETTNNKKITPNDELLNTVNVIVSTTQPPEEKELSISPKEKLVNVVPTPDKDVAVVKKAPSTQHIQSIIAENPLASCDNENESIKKEMFCYPQNVTFEKDVEDPTKAHKTLTDQTLPVIERSKQKLNFYSPLPSADSLSSEELSSTIICNNLKTDLVTNSIKEVKIEQSVDVNSKSNLIVVKDVPLVHTVGIEAKEPDRTLFNEDAKSSILNNCNVSQIQTNKVINDSIDKKYNPEVQDSMIVPPRESENLPKKNTPSIFTTNLATSNAELPCKSEDQIISYRSDSTTKSPSSKVISEIDILKALKNEILGETLDIPTNISETPLLHLPKITKVTGTSNFNAEADKKRRISLEKYKEKTTSISKGQPCDSSKVVDNSLKEGVKKLSRALTPKEFERFQSILKNAHHGDISDEEVQSASLLSPDVSTRSSVSLDDIYGDLGPKSPENEPFTEEPFPPVIIPSDFVETPRKNIVNVDTFDVGINNTFTGVKRIANDSVSTHCSNIPLGLPLKIDHQHLQRSNISNSFGLHNYGEISSSNTGFTQQNGAILNAPELRDVLPLRSPNITQIPTTSNIWNVDFPVSANYKGKHPRPIFKNAKPSNHTPNVRSYELAPNRFSIDTDDTVQNHFYASAANPELCGTPVYDARDCREKTDVLLPPWDARDKRASSIVREMPRTPIWDEPNRSSSGIRDRSYEKESCLPRPNDFGAYNVKSLNSSLCRSQDAPGERTRLERDPRLFYERRDDRLNNEFIECPPTPNRSFGGSGHISKTDSRYTANQNNFDAALQIQDVSQSFVREPSASSSFDYDVRGQLVVKGKRTGRNNMQETGSGIDVYRESNPSHYYNAQSKGLFVREHGAGLSREPRMQASVSRDLFREQNVGRLSNNNSTLGQTFTREPSVGRSIGRDTGRASNSTREDLVHTREQSFSNTYPRETSRYRSSKDERSYNRKYDDRKERFTRNNRKETGSHGNEISTPGYANRDPRSRRDLYDSNTKSERVKPNANKIILDSKSDLKNAQNIRTKEAQIEKICSRDPRLQRRDSIDSLSEKKNNSLDESSECKGICGKSTGIAYTSDNIAKGAIVGQGYGVKNYKIPRIKRAVEEPIVIEEKDDLKDQDKDDPKSAQKVPTSQTCEAGKDTPFVIIEAAADIKSKELQLHGIAKPSDLHLDFSKDVDVAQYSKKNSRTITSSLCTDVDFVGAIRKGTPKKDVIIINELNTETKSDMDSLNNDVEQEENRKKDVCIKGENEQINALTIVKAVNSSFNSQKTEQVDIKDVYNSGSTLINLEPIQSNSQSVLSNIVIESEVVAAKSEFGERDAKKPVELLNDRHATPPALSSNMSENAKLCIQTDSVPSERRNEDLEDKLIETAELFCLSESNCNVSEEENLKKDEQNLDSFLTDPNVDIIERNVNTIDNFSNLNIPGVSLLSNIHSPQKNNIFSCSGSEQASKIGTTDLDDESKGEKYSKNETKLSNSTQIQTQVGTEETMSTNSDDGDRQHVPATNANIEIPKEYVPDSTISADEDTALIRDNTNREVDLPDSTNVAEPVSESHSDISSTFELKTPIPVITNTPILTTAEMNSINSLGTILSLLQDKSKIKELLTLLSDQSNETEKLKKKLTKLTELESDEEIQDENVKTSEDASKELLVDIPSTSNVKPKLIKKKILGKKKKIVKKVQVLSKQKLLNPKRVTRSETAQKLENRRKPINRELQKLQEDIRDMFISDDVLSATGFRMCRLAKMIDENKTCTKKTDAEDKTTPKAKNVFKKNQKSYLDNQCGHNQAVVILEKAPIKTPELASNSDEFFQQQNSEILKPRKKKKSGLKTKTTLLSFTKKNQEKIDERNTIHLSNRPGPKSKTTFNTLKQISNDVPNDLKSIFGEEGKEKVSTEDKEKSCYSESEDESLSSLMSLSSTDPISEPKAKIKRKKSSWKLGIIKNKYKKKLHKSDHSVTNSLVNVPKSDGSSPKVIENHGCFTDKSYCFDKNTTKFLCKFCDYEGDRIVHHYKQIHPHIEVPLSRINADTASKAINQAMSAGILGLSETLNLESKIICRFCFKKFKKRKPNLESFFWHVVSSHTGEYKHVCSECPNMTNCPLTIDVPSPPKDNQTALMAFICGKCYYTQISLENLKTHIALRHGNDDIEVYTINLEDIQQDDLKELPSTSKPAKKHSIVNRRVVRTLRSNQSSEETNDAHSNVTTTTDRSSEETEVNVPRENILPKKKSMRKRTTSKTGNVISLETGKVIESADDTFSERSLTHEYSVKSEKDDAELEDVAQFDDLSDNVSLRSSIFSEQHVLEAESSAISALRPIKQEVESLVNPIQATPLTDEGHNDCLDVIGLHNFMVTFSKSGAKEYLCCINECYSTYFKTTLLISLKKHVQNKHKETWDGFCSVCKCTVMEKSAFKDCLSHFLEDHIDNFPVYIQPSPDANVLSKEAHDTLGVCPELPGTPTKTYINVRPMSELVARALDAPSPLAPMDEDSNLSLPRIESVVSLNASEDLSSNAVINLHSSLPRQENAPGDSLPKTVISSKQVQTDLPKSPEDAQKEVTGQKYPPVLEAMLVTEKLGDMFKCAGRYCSFTSRAADPFLVHLHAHQRLAPNNKEVLRCVYCYFSTESNPVDLVSHVFREHGHCRFACALCFYSATTGALVDSHRARLHPLAPPERAVLLLAQPLVADAAAAVRGVLTRNDAASLYMCTVDPELCKFTCYTAFELVDHTTKKHPRATSMKCFICPEMCPSVNHLTSHLKLHGLRVYQCTFCRNSFDTELLMLEHASQFHPARRPQAYLRHAIQSKVQDPNTNKPKYKVLPLVHIDFNSQAERSCEYVNVLTSTTQENPDNEAERAEELEKANKPVQQSMVNEPYIDYNLSTAFQETVATELNDESVVNSQVLLNEPPATQINKEIVINKHLNIGNDQDPGVSSIGTDKVASEEVMSLVKNEFTVQASVTACATDDKIIVLDSDEEDAKPLVVKKIVDEAQETNPTVIDISEDDMSNASKSSTFNDIDAPEKETGDLSVRYSENDVFKCGKCFENLKKVYHFQRHWRKCYPEDNPTFLCAFCPFTTKVNKALRFHLIQEHGPIKKYICGVCNISDLKSRNIVQHMAIVHKMVKVTVTLDPNCRNPLNRNFIVEPEKKIPKESAKRKRAAPETATYEPQKLKRYGPGDIGSLPINPILDEEIFCANCKFGTKVRLNMIRHLQCHASEIPVGTSAPINPVPHLENNEMHFDKMANLAASSHVKRALDRPARPEPAPLSVRLPPDAAARYPRFVTERERHACGAVGCAYISLDETMLKYHWETLHSGATAYHCVHCPPTQQLDTSRPLTATRIVAHLKMHDAKLYACANCTYYHHQKHLVEKHTVDKHGANAKPVLTLREPAEVQPSAPDARSAPTMDLKAWQCGLCKFKSMLRRDVAEHCGSVHQCKFQYKCAFCHWGSPAMDSVNRHHQEKHPEKSGTPLHAFYREGSLPDDEDGLPMWVKQRKSYAHFLENSVKMEAMMSSPRSLLRKLNPPSPAKHPVPSQPVNLELVKSEVIEEPIKKVNEPLQDLLRRYGAFCDPKVNQYVCPMCKISVDTKEAMISHLYEELNYRKWSCNICSYKAFHKIGLMEHSFHEHRETQEPKELPSNRGVELWVEKLLEYQDQKIVKRQSQVAEKSAKDQTPVKTSQQITKLPEEYILSSSNSPILQSSATGSSPDSGNRTKPTMQELENSLGSLGSPHGMLYSCPKCDFKVKEESKMTEHLENELAKVRWSCSVCPEKFHQYHEARRHCTTAHVGLFAQVVGVSKDPLLRSSWIAAVLQVQKLTMNYLPIRDVEQHTMRTANNSTPPPRMLMSQTIPEDNGLLVVRYEKELSPPEGAPVYRRKRASNPSDNESDEEKLIIDDTRSKETTQKQCPYCSFNTKYAKTLNNHVFRHFQIKPFKCAYCDFSNYLQIVCKHQSDKHPDKPRNLIKVPLPPGPPLIINLNSYMKKSKKNDMASDDQGTVCLTCDKSIPTVGAQQHANIVHPGEVPQLASRGDVVLKCGVCLSLRCDVESMRLHHISNHKGLELNYAMFRLGYDTREIIACEHCSMCFKFLKDLKCHHERTHHSLQLKFIRKAYVHQSEEVAFPSGSSASTIDNDDVILVSEYIEPEASAGTKRKLDDANLSPIVKRVAKKSTTKLPFSIRAYARKSTTKLPYSCTGNVTSGEREDYSFYGTRPASLDVVGDITTQMPFYGTLMPFTVRKLSNIIKIFPKVNVVDCQLKTSSGTKK